MGKQRTPQGRAPGRTAPPRKSLVEIIQAALPPTVPDAAKRQSDPLTRSIARAIHEPPPAHPLDRPPSESLAPVPTEPCEASADGPGAADANAFEPPAKLPEKTASVIAADPVVEATPAIAAVPAPDAMPEPVARSTRQTEPPAAGGSYVNVVPLKMSAPPVARLPEPAVVPTEPDAPPVAASALPAPASWRAGHRPVPPLRRDLEGLGETLFAFVRNEGTAALAHLAALKDVRSPADAIRLQVDEIQRAADASLTCWSEIARRATRIVAPR